MSIEEKYELFESMRENTLTKEELAQVAELNKEESFRKEFEEYCQIQDTYVHMFQQQGKEEAFISNLKKISREATMDLKESETKEISKPTLTFSKNLKWILSTAAVILFGVVGYQFLLNPSVSMEELYAQHYKSEELSVERGSLDNTLDSLIILFKHKEYSKVLPELLIYSEAHPDKNQIKLAIAICQHELNDYASCENTLQAIILQNDVYKEKAQWYLAMNFLKQGKKAELIALLKEFEESHFYYGNAKKILKALK